MTDRTPAEVFTAATERLDALPSGAVLLLTPRRCAALVALFRKFAWMVELDEHLVGRVGVDETLALAHTFIVKANPTAAGGA